MRTAAGDLATTLMESLAQSCPRDLLEACYVPDEGLHDEALRAAMRAAFTRTRAILSRMDRFRVDCMAAVFLTQWTLAMRVIAETDDLRAELAKREREAQKAQRRLGALVKLSRDPKQAAKADARELWQEWQAGRARYKSGAAFAHHVVDAFPVIENAKTVERWVTRWRKDAQTKKQASS